MYGLLNIMHIREHMSVRIYEQDAYVFEFEGTVTSVDKEWIVLDVTAFYPGGGGQVSDLGRICNLDVTEVKSKGDDICHKVPGHSMKAGNKVWCSVDWERRYDLMMGHTAEHLLFSGLKREMPDIGIVKIFISPESKYVVVDRDVDWDVIARAQNFVNDAIMEDLSVTKMTMTKDDLVSENIRAKTERIDGEFVTVVEIGDADTAACSGIHVRETGEIGALIVDRKVSAGKDGYAIHFRVNKDAVARSMELANRCLQINDILGTRTDDVVKAVSNMKHDIETGTKQIRSLTKELLNNMRPKNIGGVAVHSGIFETNDKNAVTEAAERIKNSGGVAVLITSGETLSVIMSSGAKGVNCSDILKQAMADAGGRGGGKNDFAQGGVPDVSKTESIMENILRMLERTLKQEN